MDITIRKPYLILAPVELKNLPDFIVLTGENGTGKTQFLTYLYTKNPNMIGDYHDPMIDEMMLENHEQGEFQYLDNGEEKFIPNVEITENDKVLKNVVLRNNQAPPVNIGNYLNVSDLLNRGRKFVHKYIFYKMYKESVSQSQPNLLNNIEEINKIYLDQMSIPYDKNAHTRNQIPKHFTKEDKILIEKIIANHNELNYELIQYYYIAYLPIPNSNVFSINIGFLFLQYWARKKAGLEFRESPIDVFNQVAEEAEFRYILEVPTIKESDSQIKIMLFDKKTKKTVDINNLSSGEKVIFSLVLAIYSSNTSVNFPDVILFDEPDAYLHPKMCQFMLDVLQKIFVERRKIKVIITTHSPTTVALSPEINLYQMDRETGRVLKVSKRDAIRSLTSGLNSLSVFYENIKQIFVEASFDKFYLEQVYDLVQNKYLNKDVILHFLNVGSDRITGGCDTLKKVVSDLSRSPNSSVYGIVDWDNKVHEDYKKVKILGNSIRYAIDNYVFDPIGVGILILSKKYNYDIESIGFSSYDTITNFVNKSEKDIQSIIDNIISKLESEASISLDSTLSTYQTINGFTFTIPKWFLVMKGHSSSDKSEDSIHDLYKKAFPFFKDQHIADNIIIQAYRNYPEFIPIDILETFREIQEAE